MSPAAQPAGSRPNTAVLDFGEVYRPIRSGSPGNRKPANSFPSEKPFFFSCLLAEIGRSRQTTAKVSRILHRFHVHKLIVKIPRTRRWKVTDRGRQIMATSLRMREVTFPDLYSKTAAA
jgi:hypothetical protein